MLIKGNRDREKTERVLVIMTAQHIAAIATRSRENPNRPI